MIWLALAWGMDVDEARSRAVEAALDVELARAEASAARGVAAIALSGSLPAVAGFADVSTGQGLTSFGFERPVTMQLGAGVQAQWALVDPGAWAAAAAARHSLRGREAMLEWTRVTARRDATRAFADAVAATEVRAAWARAAEDAAAGAAAVTSLVDAELRPAADAARARADAASAQASLAQAEASVVGTCTALQRLLAQEVTGRCDLQPTPWAEPGPEASPHPALIASESAARAAHASQTGALADLAPTATATGTAGWYVADEASGPGWSAGVGVDVPLYGGGAGGGQIRAAKAEARAADARLADQERQIDAARRAAEAGWEAARVSLAAREEASTAADEAYTLVDERYRSGLAGITDWLDARRARDIAAVELATARARVGHALAELEAARGYWGS